MSFRLVALWSMRTYKPKQVEPFTREDLYDLPASFDGKGKV